MAKLLGLIKKYLLEILVFGAILAVLLIDLNPDYTFVNKALDSIDYIYAAKYLYVAHQLSYPLYLLVGHLFLMLPFGTEAWRMGLVSVLSSVGTCVFLYLIIRNLSLSRWYALLGVLIFGLSAFVISQSIIVQTYPLLTMLVTGAYYFIIKKRWKLTAIMIGLGLAVHVLMGIVFVVALFIKDYRTNWKAVLISLSGILFYLYIPLRAGVTPDLAANQGTNDIVVTFLNTITVINCFMGTLSIYDLPKRILDTIGIIGVSIGVITAIPLVIYFWRRYFYKMMLFWLCAIPIFIFVGELDMQTFDYMMMAIPFLAISVCLGLKVMTEKCNWAKYFGCVVVVVVLGLGVFNINYFDIGRTLDSNMSIVKLFESYSRMPDYSILLGNDNYQMINKFNADNGKHILQVEVGKLNQELYRERLSDVNYIVSDNWVEIAHSIVELNDNVWVRVLVNPQVYEFKIVEANHDITLVNSLERKITKKVAWSWMPDNPYDILTTRLYFANWLFAIKSQFNFRLVCLGILIIGGIIVLLSKKQEVKEQNGLA